MTADTDGPEFLDQSQNFCNFMIANSDSRISGTPTTEFVYCTTANTDGPEFLDQPQNMVANTDS
jgi:hypothetical protein